jgi:hypothetical protein
MRLHVDVMIFHKREDIEAPPSKVQQRPGNQRISFAAAGRYSVDLCLSVQRNQTFDLFHACVIVQPEILSYELKWLNIGSLVLMCIRYPNAIAIIIFWTVRVQIRITTIMLYCCYCMQVYYYTISIAG